MNRNEFLRTSALLGVGTLAGLENALGNETQNGKYSGVVTNTDGKPMENVRVSDGGNVTRTNKEGRFALPGCDGGRFLFVSTPAGWKAKDAFYIRITEDIKSYDFVLEPFPNSGGECARFIQISDVEFSGGQTVWIENLRRHAALTNCAFLVSTGDICYRPGLKFNAENINSRTMNLPVYTTVGNHDLVDGEYGEQYFEELFGPCWYSFDAGKAHFVVTPMPGGDHRPSYTTAQVARWLKNDLDTLSEGTPVVIFNHSLPGWGKYDAPSMSHYGPDPYTVDLPARNVKAWIFGHYHNSQYHRDPGSGILFGNAAPANKGGIDHSVGAFQAWTVDGVGNVTVELRNTFVDHHIQPAAPNLVSIYDSAADVKSATYRASAENFEKHGELKRVSPWTWVPEGDLPKGVSLTVDATFADGQTRSASADFGAASAPLRRAWSKNFGAEFQFSAPVPYAGGVLAGTVNDAQPATCEILSVSGTGEVRWRFPVENSMKAGLCVENDRVFGLDLARNVYALEANSGKLLWRHAFGAGPSTIAATPVVKDGILYAGLGRDLAAFDVQTGEVRWTAENVNGEGTTAGHVLCGETLLVSYNWNSLAAYDIHTGKQRWGASDGNIRFRYSRPLIRKNAAGEPEILAASLRALQTLNFVSGEILRTVPANANLQSAGTPLVWEALNLLLTPTLDRGLAAFDLETFEKRWVFETSPNLVYSGPYSSPEQCSIESEPARWGDMVIFGGLDGFLYVLRPHSDSGELVQKIPLGAPVLSPVSVVNGMVYVTDLGGNLHCFQNS